MSTYVKEIKRYLSYCEKQKGLSCNSLRAYRIDMTQFIIFTQDLFPAIGTITEIDKAILQSYVQHLHEKYAPKTCKRKIASLKAFFNHLEFEDIIAINPMRKIRTSFKEPRTLPNILRVGEVHSLLSHLYQQYLNARSFSARFDVLKKIAVLELFFATGIRVGELCHLAVDAIDFDQGQIRICGKGKKERMVYVCSPEILTLLKEYMQMREAIAPSSAMLFINRQKNRLTEGAVRNIVKRLAHLLFPFKRITPHMFRHTFATSLVESGMDIKLIQELLGHSSISTTQIYLHVSNAAIKAALQTKHPRLLFSMSLTSSIS